MRSGILAFILALAVGVGVSAPAAASLLITIDKSSQRMTVKVNGQQRFVWPVSTGVAGYNTPSGTYTPFRLEKDHFSKEWDDAPMPNSIFFTPKGHAIHGSFATGRLGRPASHGCVRLAPGNAAKLFALVQSQGLYSTRIVISDRVVQKPQKIAKKGKKGNSAFSNPYLEPR
jgi:lipoprotein-anchoring transpeptidase ErfK/SrfK